MSNAMLGLTFWEGHLVESFSEQPDGSLIRGFAFSAGVGVDFER